jgi:hypothetical protein
MSSASQGTPHLLDEPPPAAGGLRRFAWCTHPSRGAIIGAWALFLVVLISIRIYLLQTLPFYLWSKDAGSYADSAWQWFDTGIWETDPRRGAVYSLLIAFCLNTWGTFWSLMLVQHLISALCIIAAVIVLWQLHGLRRWIPLIACALAYALYGGPIAAAHIIRNESLIFLFATATLIALFHAFRRDSLTALVVAGSAFGLLVLTKNVFAPLPLIVLLGLLRLHRHTRSRAIVTMLLFIAGCATPLLGDQLLRRMTVQKKPREPQAGLLLFARVAQFTRLDGGIEPELKALIRDDIVEYRQRSKLDNNIILNRTAVPRMRTHLLARGQTPSDLNRICRALAFEAIRCEPNAYARQVLGDLRRLHLSYGERLRRPDLGELEFTTKWLQGMEHPHATLKRTETLSMIAARERPETLSFYQRIVQTAWLFNFSPVLLTSLLLPLITLASHGALRWWWLTLCTVWYFNVILLSTVGKPMDRYLIPVMPIMFWTLSTAVVAIWAALGAIVVRIFRPRTEAAVS